MGMLQSSIVNRREEVTEDLELPDRTMDSNGPRVMCHIIREEMISTLESDTSNIISNSKDPLISRNNN